VGRPKISIIVIKDIKTVEINGFGMAQWRSVRGFRGP